MINTEASVDHTHSMQVYCLEIESYMLELAKPKFEAAGVADQIEVLVGSASDSIEKLLKRAVCFDIAFLDADKTGYLGYYKQLMDNQLINPGGIIVVDNALMKVCRPAWHCVFLQLVSVPLLDGTLCTGCVQEVAVIFVCIPVFIMKHVVWVCKVHCL